MPDTDPWTQALREDAATLTPPATTVQLDEGPVGLVEAATSGRARVRIISPGTGSTAHYTAEVLQEAARQRIIPAGTHMHLDHPTLTERSERPERSVATLAGVTLTDAAWESDGLYADIQTLPPFRDRFEALAPHIGVSIRGAGEVTGEQVDGRPVLARLAVVESVDFVTRAGRGGAVVALLESAQPATVEEARNAGQWLESHIHLDFTRMADQLAADGHLTREERIGLSGAIGDALTAFNARIAADLPQMYERDPYDYPSSTDPATTTTEETRMPDISQEELDRLRAAETENVTLRTDNERLQEANDQLRGREVQRTARDHAAETLAGTDAPELSERARNRVVDQVCTGDLPVTEAGVLDTAVLTSRVLEAARAEAAYLAEAIGQPAGGTGRPVGVGGGSTTTITEADLDRQSAAIFGRTIKES